MHFVLKKQEILGRIALLCNFLKVLLNPVNMDVSLCSWDRKA